MRWLPWQTRATSGHLRPANERAVSIGRAGVDTLHAVRIVIERLDDGPACIRHHIRRAKMIRMREERRRGAGCLSARDPLLDVRDECIAVAIEMSLLAHLNVCTKYGSGNNENCACDVEPHRH